MDDLAFDGMARQLGRAASRRRAAAAAVGIALGAFAGPATGEAKRCRKAQKPCTQGSQCCGKKTACGTSHGEGSNTCCGRTGAKCESELTCCIAFSCENGRCVLPPT